MAAGMNTLQWLQVVIY